MGLFGFGERFGKKPEQEKEQEANGQEAAAPVSEGEKAVFAIDDPFTEGTEAADGIGDLEMVRRVDAWAEELDRLDRAADKQKVDELQMEVVDYDSDASFSNKDVVTGRREAGPAQLQEDEEMIDGSELGGKEVA